MRATKKRSTSRRKLCKTEKTVEIVQKREQKKNVFRYCCCCCIVLPNDDQRAAQKLQALLFLVRRKPALVYCAEGGRVEGVWYTGYNSSCLCKRDF